MLRYTPIPLAARSLTKKSMPHQTAADLLSRLGRLNVRLSVNGNRLVCDAPKGVLNERLKEQLARHKAQLLEILGATESLGSVPDPLELVQGRDGNLNHTSSGLREEPRTRSGSASLPTPAGAGFSLSDNASVVGFASDPDGWAGAQTAPYRSEYELVVDRFNATAMPLDTGRTIVRLFLDKVAENPSAPAVLWSGEPPLDYRRFAARAGAVARRLISAGVHPGQTVAVCARRSPDLLAAIHGILMAGAAYAPLGADDPAGAARRHARGSRRAAGPGGRRLPRQD